MTDSLLKNNQVLNKEQLFKFFLSDNPALSDTVMYKRIADLKKRGLISNVGRGVYTVKGKNKPAFQLELEGVEKKISNKIIKKFPFATFTVWNTKFLNQFMTHQAFSNPIIIEAEKDAALSIFDFLQENTQNVFFNPSNEVMNNYVHNNKENIIIKRLVTESPLQKDKLYLTPKIEKILVDIFADNAIFITYQGTELKNIFNNAYEKYQINWTTLLSYAARRHKKEEIIEFVKSRTNIPYSIISEA